MERLRRLTSWSDYTADGREIDISLWDADSHRIEKDKTFMETPDYPWVFQAEFGDVTMLVGCCLTDENGDTLFEPVYGALLYTPFEEKE